MRFTLALVVLLAAAPAAPAVPAGAAETIRSRATIQDSDLLAEHTDTAKLVVLARPTKVWDDGRAQCQVISVYKGDYADKTFLVRFDRVLGGVWPQKGVTAIYFLRLPVGGETREPLLFNRKTIFDLIDADQALVPPTDENIAVIKLAVEGKYVQQRHRIRKSVALPDLNTLDRQVMESRYVVVGAVEEVRHSREEGVRAKVSFRIEKVFKGDIPPGQVLVKVPAVQTDVINPEFKKADPKVGPAAMMLIREKDGGALRLLSPSRGYWPLVDEEHGMPGELVARDTEKDIKSALAEERRLRAEGIIGRLDDRDTVEKTLRAWATSWNEVDIDNCISCYSQDNKWRRQWDNGGIQAKRELIKTMQAFRVADSRPSIDVTLEQVEEHGENQAKAVVSLRIHTAEQLVDVRTAVMTFVFENGMWLILEEGN